MQRHIIWMVLFVSSASVVKPPLMPAEGTIPRFVIKFERVIASDSWENFAGLSSNGPFFVDETSFVLVDAKRHLRRYYLNGKPASEIETPFDSQLLLYKVGKRIYLQTREETFQLQNGRLEKVVVPIPITESIEFDSRRGIVEREGPFYQTLVPMETYLYSFDRTFVTLPESNQLGDALLFLSSYPHQTYSLTHQLFRYDIKARSKELLLDDVFSFAFVPMQPSLLLVFASYGKAGFIPTEFPGHFAILDQKTGSFVQQFDEEDHRLAREFTISSFDIDPRGEIVAVGSYQDFRDRTKPREYSSVLLLSLIEMH